MAESDLLRVLRTLTEKAARFEKAAAHHKRIEAERKALQEAITDAQLILSVKQRNPLAEVKSLKADVKPAATEADGDRDPRRKIKKKDGGLSGSV